MSILGFCCPQPVPWLRNCNPKVNLQSVDGFSFSPKTLDLDKFPLQSGTEISIDRIDAAFGIKNVETL
jgi:hypothetical protein